MRQSRLDRELLATRSDAVDDLPAGRWWREDPIGAPGDAEVRGTHRRQAAKVVESIGPEPRPAHVPLHPFRDDLRRLVFVAEAQRPRREATQRARQGNRGGGERPPYGSEQVPPDCLKLYERDRSSSRLKSRPLA